MSRWKENASLLPLHPRVAPNPSPPPLQTPAAIAIPMPATAPAARRRHRQRAGAAGRVGYGHTTPLPKAPRQRGFLMGDDDDMDEAFLQEVDAICEEHARSTARKEKEKKLAEGNKEKSEELLAAAPAMIDDSEREIATLEDAFWEEVNAVCEESDAQSDAKSQEEANAVREECDDAQSDAKSQEVEEEHDKEEEEEEESLVLSCGDTSLPPAISITVEGGEV